MSEEAKISDCHEEEVVEKTAFAGKKFRKFKKFNGKCFKCNKFGHQARECRSGDARVAGNKGVCFMVRRNIAQRCDDKRSKVTFKLDSGASDHLSNEKWCFKNLRELKEPVEINVAKNNESIIATHYFEINGISNNGVPLNMMDVLYVPDIRHNLLSVRKLTNAGVEVKFLRDKAIILRNGELIATAFLYGNLYELNISINGISSALSSDSKDAVLWHRRLGHIGENGLRKLEKANRINDLNLKSKSIGFCDVC